MKIRTLTVEAEVSRSHNFQSVRERAAAIIELDEQDKPGECYKRASDFLHQLCAIKAEEHLYRVLNPDTGEE